jgi:hypothetical protein
MADVVHTSMESLAYPFTDVSWTRTNTSWEPVPFQPGTIELGWRGWE